MKVKMLSAFLIGLTVLVPACSRDGENIAVFRNGVINRGEFMQWLKDRGLASETAMRNREMLANELQMMAINRIAMMEARRENYAASERFLFLFGDIERRYLNAYLMEKIVREKGYNERAVRVRQILIPVREKDSSGAAVKKAGGIIAELDKGAAFEEMVKKYSEHPSKNQGGDIGYLLHGQMPRAYADAAFSLKRGEYTKEPLYLPNMSSVCILRAEDIIELTPKNITRVIPDEQRRSRMLELISMAVKGAVVDQLVKSENAVFNEQAVFSANPAAVVFKLEGMTFRTGDLDGRIRKMNDIMNEGGNSTDPESRKNIARELFTDSLLEREARRRGLDKDEKYKKRIEEARGAYLAGDYIEYMSSRGLKVTPAEIRQEYDKVYAAYSRMGKKIAPFAEVKGQVEKDLILRKRLEGREQWMRKILNEYDVKISPSITGKSA